MCGFRLLSFYPSVRSSKHAVDNSACSFFVVAAFIVVGRLFSQQSNVPVLVIY